MNYIKSLRIACAVVVLAALSACATGVPLSESPEASLPISDGNSRIMVYRTGILGAAIQPTVKVDEIETDKCQPNGVFTVDVPPGRHKIEATTEVSETLYVSTNVGETVYIECSIGFGIFVGRPKLALTPEAVAKSEVGNLVVLGIY